MLRKTMAIILTIVAVLAAGWLALRRPDIPYKTLEIAYAVPDTQFMTLDERLKVHFTDTGPRDRDTIILVHGFSASLHTWTDWKANLERDYRVITLDLPGHGLSRAEDIDKATIERFADIVLAVADARGVDRFTIAGNSMGGNTAWQVALQAPERLDALVLLNASGWPSSDEENESTPFVFKLLRNPIARTVLRDLDMSSLTRSGLEDSYSDQSFVTDELVQRYVSLSRAPGHRDTLLAIMGGERVPATAETMAQITTPTLIIWGREDNLVPVSSAQKFGETISGSKVIIYDNVGHLPHEEVAQQSVEDLRAFLSDVEWDAADELIIPAGDPRLPENRPSE